MEFSKLKKKHKVTFAILIAFAVISFWRGIWGLMDELLFPDNYQLSLWISLFLGLGVLVISGYAAKELI